MLEFEKNLENLLYATTSKDRINHLLSSTKSKDWLNHDVMFHMKVNLRRKTQSLCSNKVKKTRFTLLGSGSEWQKTRRNF